MFLSFIYSLFSHGVSSPHMTYLFLYPLLGGVIVGILLLCLEKKNNDCFWSSHLYHTGMAALILGSLLRGVFDIAGTASIYQTGLTIIGAVLLTCGVSVFVLTKIRK